MANHSSYDIVIAGGGLSGALCALALSQLTKSGQTPLSIAIVEPNPLHTNPTKSFDDRVLALSHATASYLQQLEVWPLLEKDAEAIKTIHISDRGQYGKARVYAQDHQVEALGYVVEMSLIGKALLDNLATKNNISWFCPDTINHIVWHADNVEIALDSGTVISAELLLGCDGAQSQCRQAANIGVTEKPYGQSALIANVKTAKPHNNVAYERFTETGPIAILPLTDGSTQSHKCSLVWTLTPEQAQQCKQLNEQRFKEQLIKAFGHWLGEIAHVGQRHIYPLNLVQAQEQVYHRMALIGNASHTIHPIAGQGFNLGVRDVCELVRQLKPIVEQGNDVGQFDLLTAYSIQRKQDHQHIIGLTDSLVTLFSNQYIPLVAGRNIGLKVLNYFTPLKKKFVSKTMGY